MIWLIGIAMIFGAIAASMMFFRRHLDVLTGPWIMRVQVFLRDHRNALFGN